MTRWLQAAKQAIGADAGPEYPARPPAKPVLSVLSVLSEGGNPVAAPRVPEVASVATPPRSESQPAPGAGKVADGFPYGKSINGDPLTWTGRIVQLSAWRDLTEWERHGQHGKHWNGITRRWEIPE